MKRERKRELIAQLRKTPVIQVSCDRMGIGRATYYRWHEEDKKFAKAADAAILAGALLVNDMAESQLIAGIRDRNLTAIIYWLKHHHPDYENKLQIQHAIRDDSLTPEQEAVVRKALRLAFLNESRIKNFKLKNHEKKDDTKRISGNDDKGQESTSGDN